MKLLILTSLLMGLAVQAAPLKRLFQDVKLPTQAVIETQSLTAPVASSSTRLLNAVAGPTSAAAATVTSFAAQPDFPRNLSIKASNSSVDLASCNVTVSGKDINGHSINEQFQFSAATLAEIDGNSAFASVSSVAFPANCESGSFATQWSLGVADKFGYKRCLANAGDHIYDLLNGARVATNGTVAQDSTHVQNNTIQFVSDPNGAKNYKMYFMQNYQCF